MLGDCCKGGVLHCLSSASARDVSNSPTKILSKLPSSIPFPSHLPHGNLKMWNKSHLVFIPRQEEFNKQHSISKGLHKSGIQACRSLLNSPSLQERDTVQGHDTAWNSHLLHNPAVVLTNHFRFAEATKMAASNLLTLSNSDNLFTTSTESPQGKRNGIGHKKKNCV